MRTQQYKTKVITDITQVPDGYVQLKDLESEYGDTWRKNLSDAHNAGEIRAVKIMRTINDVTGAVFICKQDADEWVRARKAGKGTKEAAKAEMVGDSALRAELKRIADAQERTVAVLERIEAIWNR